MALKPWIISPIERGSHLPKWVLTEENPDE